ncbi:MAG TPA: hypothetical protein VIE89_24055 [Candidatus Binatia bacterium]
MYPYYFFYAAALFLAFEWGKVFGGLYNEWWANYIQVFISVAVPTVAFWLIVGTEASPPLSDATRANIAATLFLGWLIPAFYGVYSRQRSAGNQTKPKSRAVPTVTTAEKVVNDYGVFMQSSAFPAPFCIADTKKLPYEKETIKEALILLRLPGSGNKGNVKAWLCEPSIFSRWSWRRKLRARLGKAPQGKGH